jgi:transcriptional regulator with XRE-family HTH domain
MQFCINIGSKIIELIKQENFYQTDFAKSVWVSREMIEKYERSEITPSSEVPVKIADTLEATLDYVVGKTSVELDAKTLKRL